MSQYTIHNSANISDNHNSFNVQNNYGVVDDRSQLLAWLSPLEPKLRHQDIRERRVENVGEWLMQTEEFRSWHDCRGEGEGDKAVLFCHGAPGVGKTFIGSLVVDRLCDQARGQNTAVTCFYFDFAARKEQSAISMLGSLLKQVVCGMEEIPEEISRAFKEQKMAVGGRGPLLPDIVKMLQAITSSVRTFVCIDALDECAVAHRVKLLDSLKQILEKSPRTRIFIIGRPHVRAEVKRRLAGRVMSISIGSSKDDIVGYLRVRLDEDESPGAMDESLAAEILKKIPEKMSEMFLLVSLSIDAILHESTVYRRREKLVKMTDGLGLGDVYGTTIERIKAQTGDKPGLGMAALMWVSHAERPLQADELCHALAVELGSTDFNTGNVPSISILVGCCQGLITVDKEASTVRLIHFTLQEYLSGHPSGFSGPHSAMAEICLTYLNSRQIRALSNARFHNTRNTPFLEYCSVYWGIHAQKELSDSVRSLALELLKENYGLIPTKFLLGQNQHVSLWRYDTYSQFSGLHCASFFGMVEVVATLIEMECYDINEGDFSGRTPLAWAARNGHEEVVKILLGREEVNLNKLDDRGRTPLSYAAGGGHEGVVKILLGRGEINFDKPDNDGRTPLSYAAWDGHEGVVEMLLGWGAVNPNQPDYRGRTALPWAIKGGHEGVVKILLGREEVNPEEPDNDGRTALSHAAQCGHAGVVKMLLKRGEVDPDKPDNYGKTPFSWAAWHGHGGVVKILLGREEVDPGRPDYQGRTALSYASWDGREGVVKMLLDQEQTNPDAPDCRGRTALSWAAGGGHEGVVKMLLDWEGVNPNKPDDGGRTPIWWAAWVGREGVVKILLEREEVHPDRPNNYGKTPLSCAALSGHEGVVKALLGQEDVNPDKPDHAGLTPLSYAAQNGHNGVVALLRSSKTVAPSTV